jgi:hypothetical protein
MRSLAQKQNQPDKPSALRSAQSNTVRLGPLHHADSVVHLQRTIGNQPLQGLPRTDTEDSKIESIGTKSRCLGHNFGRISTLPRIATAIQEKLTTNRPGDEYEREADSVGRDFSRVRVYPSAPKQSAADDGGIRLARAERGVSGPSIHLPAGPRALLEAQFGSRFEDVRLHTGPHAIDAARQLGVAAYTLGRDVAFGYGFYAAHTGRGLHLLSHELTHVIQSQSVTDRPLREGEPVEAVEPLEREAEAAANAIGSDHRAVVRERLAARIPLCHPIYISSHGDAGYLAAAAKFYTEWGYSPIHKDVPSIEAVVKSLASQSSISHVTIVSHAHPEHVMMSLIDGGPDTVLKSDWQVDTVEKLTSLERHLVDVSTLDTVIKNVQKTHPKVLERTGSLTDPIVRQFIWWVVEQVRAVSSGHGAAGYRMQQTAQKHTDLYRNRLLSPKTRSAGAGSGQSGVTANDVNAAETVVTEEAKRWPWGQQKPEPEKVHAYEERLTESPSADILRIMDNPEFLRNLAVVRSNIRSSSWIEIQGCSAGKDRDYLVGVQSFFGGGAKPIVSAPDWFQAFGHYGWTPVANDEKAAQAQWQRKGVPQAFAYWFPIITRKTLPKKQTYLDLLAYLRQGHALPLARPDSTGDATLLVLQGLALKAFLSWLSRHGYSLTKEPDIQKTLFTQKDFGKNVEGVVIDWLQEHFSGQTKTILRPSPEYEKHIIKVH